METIPIDYLTFLDETRGMKPSERSEFFDNLQAEQQKELMDTYYFPVTKKYILLQTRLVQAAHIIENEPDPKKREQMMPHYNAIETEFDEEKKRIGHE